MSKLDSFKKSNYKICKSITEGILPWMLYWNSEGTQVKATQRIHNGLSFNHFNSSILLVDSYKLGLKSNIWISEPQLKNNEDFKLRKDAISSSVFEISNNVLNETLVYNLDCLSDTEEVLKIKQKSFLSDQEEIGNKPSRKNIFRIINGCNLKIETKHLEFNYDRKRDIICTPNQEENENWINHYKKILQLLPTWTGHPSRRDRFENPKWANLNQEKEIAFSDINSAFLFQKLSLGAPQNNSIKYTRLFVEEKSFAPRLFQESRTVQNIVFALLK